MMVRSIIKLENHYKDIKSSRIMASIFPDMFNRAKKEMPRRNRGKVVLPWARGKFRNWEEVLNTSDLNDADIKRVTKIIIKRFNTSLKTMRNLTFY